MDLQNSIEKLDKYYKRLENGKARKIKVPHVEKVIAKLRKKQDALLAEIDDTHKDDKKKRLQRKLKSTREQIERADWLLEQIQMEDA